VASLAAFAALAPLACGDIAIPPSASGDDGGGDAGPASVESVSTDVDCGAAVPLSLACTGLYTDFSQLTLSPDVQPYSPGETAWNDGATSSEWIFLPAGSKIVTSDLNNWSFPVGTKLWQQLSLLGEPIETRFLWKESSTLWFRAAYAWAPDQSAATEVPAGVPNAWGLPHDIPPVSECAQCHAGASDFVLGFEIVGLGMSTASGLNLAALEQQQLLTNPPSVTPTIPAQTGSLASYFSLAYLHVNCGTSCHGRGPDAAAGQTGLFMKLTVDTTGALPSTVQATDTWATAYMVPSHFTPSGVDAGGFFRIQPGDAAASMIPWRASRRDGVSQMPPIGTQLVDDYGVEILDAWINGLR
jgi:hypothetical protein